MITLSSTQQVVQAMQHARDVTVTAYTLGDGTVLDALIAASARGAHVRVRLEGFIYRDDGSVSAANRDAIERLAAHGADAKLVHVANDAADPMLHLKGAAIDGQLFLDDRNWRDDGQDTIVRDDFAGDARMVRDAAAGDGDPPNDFFAVRKRDALAREARLIDEARRDDDVIVESESFGAGNRVYTAIDAALRRGAHVRVLVSNRDAQNNPREATAIDRLRRDGAEVHLCDCDEKFAVVDGRRGWIGSANTTAAFSHPDQLDWGLRTNDAPLIAHLRDVFTQRWNQSSS